MQRGGIHQVLCLELDFGVTSMNYRLSALLSRGGPPR